VSNDNPFSEAAFKTFKHCHAFPDHFEDIEQPPKLPTVAWMNPPS
jgi:hypothetical protein